ncbi:unnamed protein product, partial [Hymenolepis diminuta]
MKILKSMKFCIFYLLLLMHLKDNSLCIFQNYLLFAFSTIIPQFFHPRRWSDLIYVPMTHNPCLT